MNNKIIKHNLVSEIIFFTLLVFIVANFFVFSSPPAHAASVWYMTTTGIDNTACGSTTSPCRTFNYMLNNIVNPYDTIYVMSGTYDLMLEQNPSSYVLVDVAGVTITASDTSNRPLVYGDSSKDNVFKVTADNVKISYLKIYHNRNLKPIYSYRDGCIEFDNAINGTVDNCELAYSEAGVTMRGPRNSGHTITNNYVHDHVDIDPALATPETTDGQCFVTMDGTSATGWQERILIDHNEAFKCGDSFLAGANKTYYNNFIEISNNNFHDNYEDSIDLKTAGNIKIHHNKLHNDAGDAVTTHDDTSSDGDADDVEFYNNEVYSSGWWGLIIKGGCDNWSVYNNLIYGNAHDQDCIKGNYVPVGLNGGGSTSKIYNNVIYNNGPKGGYTGSGKLINNIVYNNGQAGYIDCKGKSSHGNIGVSSSGTIDNNYVYPTSPGITGSNAISVSNPMMKNPSNFDFTLLNGSPLINSGVDVGITTDFFGTPRPQGAGYDIGAYEYPSGGGGDTTAPSAPTGVTVS